MIDPEIILAKASAFQRHFQKVDARSKIDKTDFLNDSDLQDIVMFNLQMAVQNCIDIAAHIIGTQGLGVPGSNNEMFYLLEENDYIDHDVTEKMVKAVGFMNLIVHEYGKIDLDQVYQITQKEIDDLKRFIAIIVQKCCTAD